MRTIFEKLKTVLKKRPKLMTVIDGTPDIPRLSPTIPSLNSGIIDYETETIEQLMTDNQNGCEYGTCKVYRPLEVRRLHLIHLLNRHRWTTKRITKFMNTHGQFKRREQQWTEEDIRFILKKVKADQGLSTDYKLPKKADEILSMVGLQNFKNKN